MAGLTRKKVKVRGESGKVYQRSVMVRAQNTKLSRHSRTAFISGLGIGAAGGVGHYGGAVWGEKIGHKVASRAYRPNSGVVGRFLYASTVQNHAAIGANAGLIGGGVVGSLAARGSSKYRTMQKDLKANRGTAGAARIAALHGAGTALGWAGGFAGSTLTHHLMKKYRR